MKTIPIPHLIAAIAFAALALAGAVLIPEARLDKLADLVTRIVEDPAGFAALVGGIASAVAVLRGAWVRKPPGDDPPADGPPTTPRRPARHTMPPERIERVTFDASERKALATSVRLLNKWNRSGALLALTILALTGCSPSALRTHSTIATVARVSVVTAGDAIVRTCEAALTRCTDEACVERVTADCHVAGTAADAARAGVRAYVDTIEIAAHADEGAVAPALDAAVQMMARLYDALRAALASVPSLGVSLPELPPFVITLLRSLVAGVTS